MGIEIRPFEPSADRAAVADLWARALTPEWPFLPDGLALLSMGHVAMDRDRCLGMVGLTVDGGASIPFVAVDPDRRRQGLGTRLVEQALAQLREMDVDVARVSAGSGAGPYIWPGVPLDRPDAVAFFDALGWRAEYVSTDLILDLRTAGLDKVFARFTAPAGLTMDAVEPEQRETVVAFVDAHFPEWSLWYRNPSAGMIVVREDDTIVAALLVEGPGRVTPYWPLLGDDSASIGCVGVLLSHENRGIGSAMVAAASQQLRDSGAGICHIGWAVRLDFYGRVGYQPWRSYSMRSRIL